MEEISTSRAAIASLLLLVLCTDAHIDGTESGEGKYSGNASPQLENKIYSFGTVQIEPLYSQYGDGFIRNLTDRIARRLGIRHKIVSYSATNGAWDNLVHTVANGEIDIGASLLTVTPSRSSEVSFSTPFLTSTLSILYHGNRGYIRRPTELLSSGFRIGTLNTSGILDILAESPKTYVQDILSVINAGKENLVSTVQEGVDRARHQKYAFIIDTAMAEYLVRQRPCELRTRVLSEEYFDYGFITRLGSSLHRTLSAAILQMEKDESLPELVKEMVYTHETCEDDAN